MVTFIISLGPDEFLENEITLQEFGEAARETIKGAPCGHYLCLYSILLMNPTVLIGVQKMFFS